MNRYSTFIAYSTNSKVRLRATSGGICSEVITYLLSKGFAKSALSFRYNSSELKYEPKLINCADDYCVSASIYHEIPIFTWIKEHVNEIQSPFVFTALPCQVKPIKTFLFKHNIESYAIQLVCSSQQSYEATEFLLKCLDISKNEVHKINYRGDGWPNGISVYKTNGEIVKVSNTGSIWSDIFHSRIFCMPRCFHCNPNMTLIADIICADPWRIDNAKTEKVGRTLCYVKNDFFNSVFKKMCDDNIIAFQECQDTLFYYSQEGVIKLKEKRLKHMKIIRLQKKVYTSSFYRSLVLSSFFTFKAHLLIKKIFEKIFIR